MLSKKAGRSAGTSEEVSVPNQPVSSLYSHGEAVVELQPGDVSQAQHYSGTVGPADALCQPLQVRPGTVTCSQTPRDQQQSQRPELEQTAGILDGLLAGLCVPLQGTY